MVRHFLSPVVTKAVAAFVVGCALVLPARAHAQTHGAAARCRLRWRRARPGFRRHQGQIAISGDALTRAFDKANHAGWIFERSARRGLLHHAGLSVGRGRSASAINDASDKGFLVGGRAGYNFNVTEQLGIWGRAGISYNHVSARHRGDRGLVRPHVR